MRGERATGLHLERKRKKGERESRFYEIYGAFSVCDSPLSLSFHSDSFSLLSLLSALLSPFLSSSLICFPLLLSSPLPFSAFARCTSTAKRKIFQTVAKRLRWEISMERSRYAKRVREWKEAVRCALVLGCDVRAMNNYRSVNGFTHV